MARVASLPRNRAQAASVATASWWRPRSARKPAGMAPVTLLLRGGAGRDVFARMEIPFGWGTVSGSAPHCHRALMLMDGLARGAQGCGWPGREAPQIDRFAAVQAMAEALVGQTT